MTTRNPERDAKILALIAEGKSSSWIGQQFNMTKSRVSQIGIRHGVLLHYRGGDEFRKRSRAHLAGLRAEGRIPHNFHPDHDTRLAAIERAAAEGLSYGQVAKLIGVTRNTVAGLAKRHNIRFGATTS